MFILPRKKENASPCENFCAEMNGLANAFATEKNFISVVSRLANAFATEENFRAGIVGRVRVFFVCVSGIMESG